MAQSGNCPNNTASDAFNLDGLMVVVSVIMGILAVLLLVRGLLDRFSGAATTHPTIRFFLWVVFALFLPLTSSMFSAAKNSRECLRAELILLWMLLAELLLKKLEGVRTINASPLQGVNKQSTWDAVDQIVRIAWIGYLIYQYAPSVALITLWAFSIIKVAQRVAAVAVAKRSFALGKNADLIAGYMRQLSEAEAGQQQRETAETGEGEESATWMMTACEYVITGEDKVKTQADPHGYILQLEDRKEKEKMVTVGDVWGLAVSNDALFSSEKLKLKDLCLSFALYKLLRRRFEEYPCAEAGRRESLDFLLCGLLGDDKDISPHDRRLAEEHKGDDKDISPRDRRLAEEHKGDDKDDIRPRDGRSAEEHKGEGIYIYIYKGERVFRVVEDELTFLSDYYYSTIRATLPNPWFFVLNAVLAIVILFSCCIVILISVLADSDNVFDFRDSKGRSKYDLIVSVLIIATLFLLEFADAVSYVLSDWVMVSLLCTYAKKPSWRRSASVRWALTVLRRVKTCLTSPELKFNQHSILEPRGHGLSTFSQLVLPRRSLFVQSMLLKRVLCRLFLGVQRTPVPKEVKAAIVKYLVDSKGCRPVLPIGESVLRRNGTAREELLQACKSEGAAETIIVWHIATCLYEMKHPSPPPSDDDDTQANRRIDDTQANRRIAETLSKYCAYLVALAPELLPDDTAGTETAYKAAVKEIQAAILKPQRERKADDFERVRSMKKAKGTAAERGAELGYQLVEQAAAGDEHERRVWKLLAELWTEIVVYVAPSDHVKSHAQALAPGGEFVTHIWALLTHGGILRWPAPPPPPAAHDHSPV